MIEINLLPQEIKKKKRKIKLPDISFLPVVAGDIVGTAINVNRYFSHGITPRLKAFRDG